MLKAELRAQETNKFDSHHFVINSIVKIQNKGFHIWCCSGFESRSDTNVGNTHQHLILKENARGINAKTRQQLQGFRSEVGGRKSQFSANLLAVLYLTFKAEWASEKVGCLFNLSFQQSGTNTVGGNDLATKCVWCKALTSDSPGLAKVLNEGEVSLAIFAEAEFGSHQQTSRS